jgi:hypothetical protein
MARILPLCFVIAVLLLLCGCPAAPLMMPGLTLPPGSVEVSRSEQKNPAAGMPPGMPALPLGGTPDKTLVVGFSNTLGWAAVDAHYAALLKGKGFDDSMGGMAGMAGMLPPGQPNPFEHMRMYMKDGAKYAVMVTNMSAMMNQAMAGQAGSVPGGTQAMVDGMGEFTVTILKYK